MTPVYLFPPSTRRPPGYSTSLRQRAAGPHHLHVVYQQGAPFSDTGRVNNMFTIDGQQVFGEFHRVWRSPPAKTESRLAPSQSAGVDISAFIVTTFHSHNAEVCSMNCTRQLFTLYWTHHMTRQLKLNNCAGCMRKRSLLSTCLRNKSQTVFSLQTQATCVSIFRRS